MRKTIKCNPISDKELDEEYGNHLRHNIGDCFMTTDKSHYFMQREKDVLHLRHDIINSVHNSVFDDKDNLVQISKKRFINQLRQTVFNLDIYKYSIDLTSEDTVE